MLDLIFFAALAAFVLVKLFNTLGKIDSDQENRAKSRFGFVADLKSAEQDRDVPTVDISIVSGLEASLAPEIRDVFDQIRRHSPNFHAEQFVKGARSAFNMILEAFNHSDVATLKKLLTNDVLKDFKTEIERRNNSGYTYSTIIVGIKECEIIKAGITGDEVMVSVRIVSEQINTVTDAQGNLLEGSPDAVDTIEDIWTFSRKLKSTTGMWLLVQATA